MAKEVEYGHKMRNKILEGLGKLSKVVGSTLGPSGSTVLIQKGLTKPIITKDGVTLAKEFIVKDPIENLGVKIGKQAAENTVAECGDGTTTTTVLAYTIYAEGLKHISAGHRVSDIKRGIDKCRVDLVRNLKVLSKPIESTEDIYNVATISANGDTVIGALIRDAIDAVGKHGHVSVKESKLPEDRLIISEGISFDRGYKHVGFVNNRKKNTVEMEDVHILLLDHVLSDINTILDILNTLKSKNILIIADDISEVSLTALLQNKMRGILNICVIKAPGFGDRRKEILTDIAIAVGGKVVGDSSGIPLNEVSAQHIGKAKMLEVNKSRTSIIGGNCDKEEMSNRLSNIASLIQDEATSFDKGKLEERLAMLNGGAAIIHVGGNTEAEVKERRDRIDDALGATKAALLEGIVRGGGVALVEACLTATNADCDAYNAVGYNLLLKAVEAPLRTICDNAEISADMVFSNIKSGGKLGYDYRTGTGLDMYDINVIDPVKVTRVALENAVSTAGVLLTSNVAMVEEGGANNELPDLTGMPGLM